MTESDNLPPLVSVLISSYNHADFIEASIRSVYAQSYPNIELLVVDDGSRDGSVEVIRRLQAELGFDFVAQANKGLCTTLNEMIGRSKGRYVAPLGSDDVMLPERFSLQVPFMEQHPETGICAGGIVLIDGDGKPLPDKKQRHRPARRLDFDDLFMDRKPGPPAPTLLFRREALEEALWGDNVPDSDSLRSHIHQLRQALDKPFDRPLLHTVHGVGFRLAEDGDAH